MNAALIAKPVYDPEEDTLSAMAKLSTFDVTIDEPWPLW